MPSSEVLRRVPLVRTDVSEKRSASIIRVTRIGYLRILASVAEKSTLRTRATRRNIPEDGIILLYKQMAYQIITI
jgi:hypothetical protein